MLDQGVGVGIQLCECGPAAAVVFPDGDRLGAIITATEGSEYLLFRLQPFISQFMTPDYMVWSREGVVAAGFFSPDWDL